MGARRLVFLVALLAGAIAVLMLWPLRRQSGVRTTVATTANAPAVDAPVELAASHDGGDGTEPTSARTPFVSANASAARAIAKETGSMLGTVRSSDSTQQVDRGSVSLFLPAPDPSQPRDRAAELSRGVAKATVSIRLDGSFSIEGVTPGEWKAQIDAPGFERHERLAEVKAGAVTHVDVTVIPHWKTPLEIQLRHPNGLPLLGTIEAGDYETAGALRLVLFETCPTVGAKLSTTSRLKHRTTDVRKDPQRWMMTMFKQPTSGCACVALGDRVLDAVPFTAGQAFVVLTVDPAALRAQLCSCEFDVRADDVAGTPLPGAWVRFTEQDGRSQVVHPDESGRVRVEQLLSGEVEIAVSYAGYASVTRRITLVPGTPNRVETILLGQSGSIRGNVLFTSADPKTVLVSLVRLLPDGKQIAWGENTAYDHGEFKFFGLPVGDYIVGMKSEANFPDAARVKNREVAGWQWIQIRSGTEATTQIVLTEDMWPKVRAQMPVPPTGRR